MDKAIEDALRWFLWRQLGDQISIDSDIAESLKDFLIDAAEKGYSPKSLDKDQVALKTVNARINRLCDLKDALVKENNM